MKIGRKKKLPPFLEEAIKVQDIKIIARDNQAVQSLMDASEAFAALGTSIAAMGTSIRTFPNMFPAAEDKDEFKTMVENAQLREEIRELKARFRLWARYATANDLPKLKEEWAKLGNE